MWQFHGPDGRGPSSMPRSKMATSSTAMPWRFWIVFSFGALIRFAGLGHKQLWLDELIQAVRSSPGSFLGVLKSVADDRAQAPLDYVIQHYLARLLGQSAFALRFHAAVFGTLTILALYYFARSVIDERTALMTSILYAVYPLHHAYSQEARPYALFTLLAVCSYLLCWHLLLAGKTKIWLAYIVVTALLFYTNFFGLFAVFSQFVFTVTLLAPRISRSLPGIRKIGVAFVFRFATAVAASAALFLPWIVMGIRTNLVYSPLPERFDFKLFLRFLKELSDRSFPLSAVLITLAVLGIRKLVSEEKLGHVSFLLCWFLLPLPFIFLLVYLEDYFFAIRQILFATPAFYILISLGILHLSEIPFKSMRVRWMAQVDRVVALVVLMSTIQIGLHFPDRREDLKGAGQFLKRNVSAGDIVVAPGAGNILSFYFSEIFDHMQVHDEGSRRNGGLSDLPGIHHYLQPVAALGDISGSLASGKRVFVVESRNVTHAEELLIRMGSASAVTVQRTEFKGVEIIELEGANTLSR